MRETLNGFVDIHSHLLPGIDDGPAALAGSLEMARAAAAAGTRCIAATPHLRADFPRVRVGDIAPRCSALRREASAAGIDLEIVSGAETSLAWALHASDDDLAQATYGQLGSDLLVETPGDVSMLEDMLYRVQVRGLRVILAHPERSRAFKQDPKRIERLSAQGVLLQINADGLIGPRTSSTRSLAEDLCRKGLAHVVASDGHRASQWRPVGCVAPAFEALSRLVGPARASWMTHDVPAAVLKGLPLPDAPDLESARRTFWRIRGRS